MDQLRDASHAVGRISGACSGPATAKSHPPPGGFRVRANNCPVAARTAVGQPTTNVVKGG